MLWPVMCLRNPCLVLLSGERKVSHRQHLSPCVCFRGSGKHRGKAEASGIPVE